MRRASLAILGLVALALATCGCAQSTQIVLVVDSDLMLSSVTIDVSSSHSPPSRATADFSMPSTPNLPLTLAIYPRSSADINVFVTVVGTLMSGTTIERDVQTHFVPGSSRMLRVLLAARCVGRTCSAGETCDETGCRAIAIAGPTLPEWTGSAPSLSGMAACAVVPEICNGQDDDCDMRADESFDLSTDALNCGTCGNACTSGACANGFCSGEQITHLAAGGAHTCAASMSGALTCWGWNGERQLGNELYEANSAPSIVHGVTGVASVGAGGQHTCTVDTAGRCGCFGDGQDGELGRGAALDSSHLASVAGAATYASVVGGVGATCAIDPAHVLFCWGQNDRGQLGNGSMTPSSMPAGMVLPNVSSVSMGFEHACAVTMGHELYCWGSNTSGQRGTGVATGPGMPILVPGVSDAIGVACGRDFTCFIHMGGAIDCMGGNLLGQLGDGTNTTSSAPVRVMSVTDASSVSAPSAGTHVCAVRSTGLLACWGGNASGQLGDGTTLPRNAPVMVPMPTDIAAVAAGGLADDGTGHTCALDREGRVWCWGDGALGQLGTGDFMSRSHPTLVLGALHP